MSKPREFWIHEAFKDVGTTNWTVREQKNKPSPPTAYPNDWFHVREVTQADEAMIKEAKLIISKAKDSQHGYDGDCDTDHWRDRECNCFRGLAEAWHKKYGDPEGT